MTARFWRIATPRPLAPTVRQRLDGWLDMLDGDPDDLELAQRVLRRPLDQLPLPPVAMPAVLAADGTIIAAAIEPPGAAEPPPVAAASPPRALGAYARRAARRSPG